MDPIQRESQGDTDCIRGEMAFAGWVAQGIEQCLCLAMLLTVQHPRVTPGTYLCLRGLGHLQRPT